MWLLILLIIVLFRPPWVMAAEFYCAAGDVPCLVGALGKANSQRFQRADIYLPAGTWTLTQPDSTDTEGATGLPTITSRVTIAGAGAGQTIIERAEDAPLFRLFQVAPEGVLTLEGLTLQGGEVDIDFLERGGGIRNLGSLTIQDFTPGEDKVHLQAPEGQVEQTAEGTRLYWGGPTVEEAQGSVLFVGVQATADSDYFFNGFV